MTDSSGSATAREPARTVARRDSNPVRAEANWPPAVIAGAYRTGVLGVRSLVRRGVRATCFDSNTDFPGFRSVYGRAHACPNPDVDAAGWVDFMIDLARSMPAKPVLISSVDHYITAITKKIYRLEIHYVLNTAAQLQ